MFPINEIYEVFAAQILNANLCQDLSKRMASVSITVTVTHIHTYAQPHTKTQVFIFIYM